jgi:hypothetical protein
MLTYKKFIILKEEEEQKVTSAGKEWHEKHPVDHMNIVDHFDKATKGEVHNGKSWYKDAHEYANTVSRATGLPRHTVAGLTSVYSPQRDWHNNMIDASRVARRKTPIGGKTQKPYYKYGKAFAGEQQSVSAQRLLSGEHYDKVITGQKTHAFASLIDHGGDKDPKNPHVVVDRHAHSVASGARITDAAFGAAGLKSKKGYDKVKQAYIQATDHINSRSGAKVGDSHYIHPHQLQAVTWLVRQRLNSKEDSEGGKDPKALAKSGKARETAKAKWKNYSGTWHPGVSHLFKEEEDI